MKEKLIERLKLISESIVKKTQELHQANADLNLLNGCSQELTHIINMMNENDEKSSEQNKSDNVDNV